MPESIEPTDIVLRMIGAFYAFAGLLATHAGLTSYFLDKAIAAISLRKPSRAETTQAAWLIGAAALILAGGVLLLAGLELAAFVFALSALGQAAYIYGLAPRYFDRENPPDASGRRQTTNAFVLFCAATAFVLWAAWRGRLKALDQATAAELVAVGAALTLYVAYVARTLWWLPRKPEPRDGSSTPEPDADTPSRPLHESTRIQVMAEYACDPLWAMDDDLYGCFPPESLDISSALIDDINAWSAAYQAAFNPDDPAAPSAWSEARHAAHQVEGRRLAGRLKRERPDLEVCVLDPEMGNVEVHADEPA